MDASIAPLYETLKLNTRLFLNALDGVDDATAQKRPSDDTNSMIFIACHLLDARAYLAEYLGIDYTHPYKQIFDSAKRFDEIEPLPPLDGLRTAWREVSELLAERFPKLTDTDLRRKSSLEFPVDDPSVLGGVAFLLAHESFHCGQIAYLRRLLGLDPMSYT
jgi:uncharacterized damage-inducible protein DinB